VNVTTVASSLLNFILDLFNDPAAAAAYQEDPEQALEDAGLGDCTPADVEALKPMVAADHSPVSYGGGHHAPAERDEHDKDDKDGDHGKHHDHDKGDHGNDWNGHGHEAAVIHNVRYVENHYSHTETTEIEIDASHSIWVSGDAQAIFGDDNIVADSGGVAAGDDVEDVEIDNSVDNSVDVDVEDSFNDNSTNVEGVGNAVGEGAEVEDSFNTDLDLDVDVEDSFNTENSGNTQTGTGNVVGEENEVDNSTDNSTDLDVEIEESFNEDNSTDLDVEVEDSFNETDNSTDVDVEIEDSFTEENTLEIEESFNENALGLLNNTGEIEG
jgi:hypothetical protein